MRDIVLDTETTGLDPFDGHRIVEIGAIELVHRRRTGRTFHYYLNPEREMPPEAFAVHGLSDDFLKDKPLFSQVVQDFMAFIEGASLVIHNAPFDLKFLNHELTRVGVSSLSKDTVLDTLLLARKKHPGSPNTLDALCRRYGINNTLREKHGALLDADLLVDVYIELMGGKQTSLSLETPSRRSQETAADSSFSAPHPVQSRPHPLPSRLSPQEEEAHRAFIDTLGPGALWERFGGP